MWWVYVLIIVALVIGLGFATVYSKDFEQKEQFKTLEAGFGRIKARKVVWWISLPFGIVLFPFSIIYIIKRRLEK